MDKNAFKELVGRLEEAASIVKGFPSEIRAAAFALLEPYIKGEKAPAKKTARDAAQDQNNDEPGEAEDGETFFTKHDHDKPANNVKLIAAFLYSKYGSQQFSVVELEKIANDVGVTIPDRPYATLEAAKNDGKALFMKMGKGNFKPTVHGESYLKKTYAVKKGTQKRQATEE